MYDLTNIFEVFLPQLLLYPNPTDPLNAEAAALQLKNEEDYHKKIKDYIEKHASPQQTKDKSAQEEKKEKVSQKVDQEKRLDNASTGVTQPTNEKEEEDDYVEKEHESELSATSDIEMMDIDDDQ